MANIGSRGWRPPGFGRSTGDVGGSALPSRLSLGSCWQVRQRAGGSCLLGSPSVVRPHWPSPTQSSRSCSSSPSVVVEQAPSPVRSAPICRSRAAGGVGYAPTTRWSETAHAQVVPALLATFAVPRTTRRAPGTHRCRLPQPVVWLIRDRTQPLVHRFGIEQVLPVDPGFGALPHQVDDRARDVVERKPAADGGD